MPEVFPAAAPRATRRRRLAVALFVLLVIAPLAAVEIISNFEFRPAPGFLEVEMRATGGTVAQLFWTSTWGFSQPDSTVLPLHTRPGDFDRLRFPLPDQPLEFLRFDPLDGAGGVVIRKVQVLDPQGRVIRTIDPIVMSPLHQIASITPDGQDLRVVTTADANDPMLLMRAQWLLAPPRWFSVQFVTPFSLAWLMVAAIALVAAAIGLIAREVRAGPFGARHALWFAALFAAVIAAKLTLLAHYPMPVPFWDQWDGELAGLYVPFANGGLTWRQMFTLHNEHRIFFTRLLAVTLLTINGQWDPQLQIVVNFVIQATMALIVAAVLWVAAGRRWLGWIVAALALAIAAPMSIENALAGFQSQFALLALFSTLALWLMGCHRPGSVRWGLGWTCAFCACFTVAGGLLTVVAIGCIVVLETLADPRAWRQAAVNLAALAAVACVSYLALSPPLPYHDYLRVHSFLEFKVALARNLAFPWPYSPRVSVLVWLPVVGLVLAALVRRFRTGVFERYVLGLAAWVLLQSAAVAYSRGANGAVPASRYLDMLSFGFVVNSMALLWLVGTWRAGSRRSAIAGWSVVAVWFAVGAVGIAGLSDEILGREARERRQWMQAYVQNLRQAIFNDDRSALIGKVGPKDIPYYDAGILAGWLRHPYVRSIMPATLRRPLPLASRAGSVTTFDRPITAKDPSPVWDSFAAGGAAAMGQFESEPVRCSDFQRLRFEVAGAVDSAGLGLSLKEAGSGRETVVPAAPGRGWRSVRVRCPDGPFSVIASDASPSASFGFRAPAEIAWASALAERIIELWRVFAGLAAALALAALVYPLLRRRSGVAPDARLEARAESPGAVR